MNKKVFIDASALVAILCQEPDAIQLLECLAKFESGMVSPLVMWETNVAIAHNIGLSLETAQLQSKAFCEKMNIALVGLPLETTALALSAFDNYGKGRNKAGLNFGDCFAYACAKHYKMPLLYKGDDFGLTDIEAA